MGTPNLKRRRLTRRELDRLELSIQLRSTALICELEADEPLTADGMLNAIVDTPTLSELVPDTVVSAA